MSSKKVFSFKMHKNKRNCHVFTTSSGSKRPLPSSSCVSEAVLVFENGGAARGDDDNGEVVGSGGGGAVDDDDVDDGDGTSIVIDAESVDGTRRGGGGGIRLPPALGLLMASGDCGVALLRLSPPAPNEPRTRDVLDDFVSGLPSMMGGDAVCGGVDDGDDDEVGDESTAVDAIPLSLVVVAVRRGGGSGMLRLAATLSAGRAGGGGNVAGAPNSF